jgi:hypothetical protein
MSPDGGKLRYVSVRAAPAILAFPLFVKDTADGIDD